MNDENQMREQLLQHNGIHHETVPTQDIQKYQSFFSANKLFRFFLILLSIVLWVAVAVTHVIFTACAFVNTMSMYSRNDSRISDVAISMTIACISEPFLIAAAGILTYYLYTQSKQMIMSDIQKRLMQIEKQLTEQSGTSMK